MTAMDYFRRPQLMGKALPRLTFGTVRGNLRRSDPGVSSAVPYFPGVTPGMTLTLKAGNGFAYSVSLSGNGFQAILNDINAVISSRGIAKDADGSIEISTTVPGGYVEITGGTGSALLGFSLLREAFKSVGGDIPSSPEARQGNPFGSGFPMRGEDLTASSMNRGLGRLAANMDVLYADLVRPEGRLSKIAAFGTTVTSPAAGTSIIDLPSGTNVYTGKGVFPIHPTPEDLAPYFQLVDPTSGLPAATSRVVGIVRGAVSGSPSYADASLYTDTGNVSNILLTKVIGTAISLIEDGRVVTCPGADFITAAATPGDWVAISGATNLTPYANNGFRWVVESVLDATHLALRPMSQSEYILANGASPPIDTQPLTELNDNKISIESYGTLDVYAGTYAKDVRLVVQPEIPAGVKYDVWCAQPKSVRTAAAGSWGDFSSHAVNISQRDPLPNGLVSGFQLTNTGTLTRVVGEGYVRVHGKLLRVPQVIYTPAGLGGVGTYHVYFDVSSGTIKVSSTGLPATGRVSADPTGVSANPVIFPIARFASTNGTNFTSSVVSGEELSRFSVAPVERITVGDGGEFANLSDAATYINSLANSKSESSTSFGAYPHFDVVLLNSQTASVALTFQCQSLSIRGATPLVRLGLPAGTTPLTLKDCLIFEMKDLVLGQSGTTAALITLDLAGSLSTEIYLRRVRHDGAGDLHTHIVKGVSSGKMKRLVMEDCNLLLGQGVSAVDSLNAGGGLYEQEIYINRSTISSAATLAADQVMFKGESTTWGGKALKIRDTYFRRWTPPGNTLGLMVDATLCGSQTEISLENVKIDPITSFSSGSNVLLIEGGASASVRIHGLYVNGEMPRIVSAGNGTGSVVEDVVAQVRPEGSIAVRAPTVRCCHLIGNTPTVYGTLINVSELATGNQLSGRAFAGITSSAVGAQATFNTVSINTSSATGITVFGISYTGPNALLFGNNVGITTASANLPLHPAAIRCTGVNSVVHGCRMSASNGYAFRNDNDTANTDHGLILNGCILANTTDVPASGLSLARLENGVLVSSCRFQSTNGVEAVYVYAQDGGDGSFVEPVILFEGCTFPLGAAAEIISFDSKDGTYVRFVDCSGGKLSDFAGTILNCSFTGDVQLAHTGRICKSSVNDLLLDVTGVDVDIWIDEVVVRGAIDAGAVSGGSGSELRIRGTRAALSSNISSEKIWSEGNTYAQYLSVLCTDYHSRLDSVSTITVVTNNGDVVMLESVLDGADITLTSNGGSSLSLLQAGYREIRFNNVNLYMYGVYSRFTRSTAVDAASVYDSNAGFQTVTMDDCQFEDEFLIIGPPSAANSYGTIIANLLRLSNCRFRAYNENPTGVTSGTVQRCALRVVGDWRDVQFTNVLVLVNGQYGTTNIVANGVRFDGITERVTMTGCTFRISGLKTNTTTTHLANYVSFCLFFTGLVDGVISGCLFEVPAGQVMGSQSTNYHPVSFGSMINPTTGAAVNGTLPSTKGLTAQTQGRALYMANNASKNTYNASGVITARASNGFAYSVSGGGAVFGVDLASGEKVLFQFNGFY